MIAPEPYAPLPPTRRETLPTVPLDGDVFVEGVRIPRVVEVGEDYAVSHRGESIALQHGLALRENRWTYYYGRMEVRYA